MHWSRSLGLTQEKKNYIRVAPLRIATKNGFSCHRIGDRIFLIATTLTTKKWQLKYFNFTNQTYFLCFFNGGKVKHVESMLFDAKRQARDNEMQVLWQCHFIPQG
jgi:hypothetical protein